jgi:hypothetical protein
MAGLVLAGLILALPEAGAARCPKADREACRECFDAALVDGVPGVKGGDGCPEAESLVTGRRTRTQEANIALGVCKEAAPEEPGSCGRTIRALNRCLRTRQVDVNQAWTLFKGRARARCGQRAVAVADRERRACLRDEACGCPVAVASLLITTSQDTTTTTTTSTSTSTTSTTAASGTTTTTTTVTTTTSPPLNPTGSVCQGQCIARVAGNCYARCRESCGGSVDALPKCQRACRNRQCTDLRAVCAPTDNTDFESNNPGRLDEQYFVCCKGPRGDGECELDDSDGVACVPTTTSTTSTTETTTTTVATTTTLVFTTTTLQSTGTTLDL